jgi:hypothetical protein
VAYVDFILNLAALLLWINWRALPFDPLNKRRPATLIGTLRPAGRRARATGNCPPSSADCFCCARCFTGRSVRRSRRSGRENWIGASSFFRSAAIPSGAFFCFHFSASA